MPPDDGRWIDADAGPVSRPYTVTGGRTRPRSARYFDLIDLVARTAKPVDTSSFSPERSAILVICRVPLSVAELSAAISLPIGVVRVLLDDLVQENLIEVRSAAPRGPVTDRRLLQKVLDGLHAL